MFSKEILFGNFLLALIGVAMVFFLAAAAFGISQFTLITSICLIFIMLQSFTLLIKGYSFEFRKENPGSFWNIFAFISIFIAARYGVSPRTFRRYVISLGIPHIKLGRKLLFDPERVDRYLEQQSPVMPDKKASRGVRTEKSRFAGVL